MPFERPSWKPFLIACGVFLAFIGVAGWDTWTNRSREFHGKLFSCLNMPSIPEDPMAIACLAMPGVNYELRFPPDERWPPRSKLADEITRLNGKDVIIRGKLVTWRSPFMKKPQSRLHTGIEVYEMRLDPG
jgi:hypothetical protein